MIVWDSFLWIQDQVRFSPSGAIAPDLNIVPIAADLFNIDGNEMIRLVNGWRIFLSTTNQMMENRSRGQNSSQARV